MAYRAEIEIVAKGVTKVTQLQKGLNQLAKQIDHLNGPGSLKDFNSQLAQAKKLLDRAQQGTVEEKRAVDKYVTALKNANTAQVRTNKLIAEEIRQRDGATASLKRYNAAAASARQPGGSMAGRYLRPGQARGTTQFAGPIGPGPASSTALSSRLPASSRFFGGTQYSGPIGPGPVSSILGGQSSAVEGRVKRILEIKKGELQLEKALIGLQQKSRGLDAASIADNNRILDIKAKEVSRNNEIIRQEKVRQSILRKRQRLEAAGRGPGGSGKGLGKRKFTDIATGAGFPLLFGGGPLQALAGGLGGAAGGLGGAIAASAITAQVEAFAKEAAKVGQALNSTSGALELMREKSLFSTDAAKERAVELENLGQVEELAAHLGKEMANAIGNEGVKALQDLGDTTKETTRLWNLLTVQLFRLISGPLNAFLEVVNEALGGITVQQQVEARKADLGADGAAALDARIAELAAGDTSRLTPQQIRSGKGKGVGALSKTEARTQALGEAQFQVAAKPLPITKQDQRDFLVKGGRTEKDRLPSLDIELGLKEKLLVLNKQIAQAVLDEDKVAQTLLEKEKVREVLAADIDKIKTKGLKTEVEAKEIAIARVGAAQNIQNIDSKAAQAKAQEAKKVEELVGNLEDEGALIQAKLNGREDEVRLTQEIAEKTEGLEKGDAARVESLIRGNAQLKEQAAIAEKMQKIYDQIGQSIASGVVDTLSAAVDQTKSLADAAANTLRNVASILLQLGVNTALKGTGSSLFSGLTGFADGGRPPVGKPSIVGERGPELFVPNTSGTIVPNNKLGGGGATNVVVNVDAKGSSASGDSGAGKQLGGLIGAAVQAELIKQQRPGGLLSS